MEIRNVWANIPTHPPSTSVNLASVKLRSLFSCLLLAGVLAATAPTLRAQSAPGSAAEQELEPLAQALRESKSAADYNRLRAFATAHSGDEFGWRAALALGYHDFTKNRHAEAQSWLARAERDPLLREYALYWSALASRGLGQHARALEKLETLRRAFPNSVMNEQAAQALAETALAMGRGQQALEALAGLSTVAAKTSLLVLRARANERAGQLDFAAADYATLYYKFPLSAEAKQARARIEALRRSLGRRFPVIAAEQRLARPEAFFDARRWKEARAEFTRLLPELSGTRREQAQLRLAQIRAQSRRPAPGALAALQLTDPELDAERLYQLSQLYRAKRDAAKMLETIVQLAAKYPQSPWTETALFAAGNYYWVALDRETAALYYRRVFEQFPNARSAPAAHWRVAWADYLARRPQAVERMEEHLRRFPGSPFTPSAIYWLGRTAERDGNVPHARSFYLKLLNRFPETYFGMQAGERMLAVGAGPTNASEVLSLIPAERPLASLDEPIPPAAQQRWERARALRMIAFDASAEMELRAAHAETGAPRLLLEAARAALDAGRIAAGIAIARQAFPQLESRRLEEGPAEVWRVVYPLPYETEIEKTARNAQVDPMIVAGLIRQESMFQPAAVSRAGAIGLMQVMPKTGRQLARQLRLRYARARLTQPEYNLRLGTKYFADLIRQFGRVEAALAAYNGGDFRAPLWVDEREHEEPAEFVESIPLSETREYVQNVLRNAEVYRRLYGKKP